MVFALVSTTERGDCSDASEELYTHYPLSLIAIASIEGMYLPVIAVLGGMLFMRPSGFKESKRDVIRLTPVIAEIEQQQGHITCEPMRPEAGGLSLIHI